MNDDKDILMLDHSVSSWMDVILEQANKRLLMVLVVVGAIIVMGFLTADLDITTIGITLKEITYFKKLLTDIAVVIFAFVVLPLLLFFMLIISANNDNSSNSSRDYSNVKSKTEKSVWTGAYETTIYNDASSYAEGVGNTPEESQGNSRMAYERYKKY